jgi:hypothetical protein
MAIDVAGKKKKKKKKHHGRKRDHRPVVVNIAVNGHG